MTQVQTDNLVRKQVILSESNIQKLKKMSEEINIPSVSQLIRNAIDSYKPDPATKIDEEYADLIELADSKIKEAIKDTIETRKELRNSLNSLSTRTDLNGN